MLNRPGVSADEHSLFTLAHCHPQRMP